MKVASFNVNSVKARLHHIQDWLKENAPDILMIQELKSVSENVPTEAFETLGYQCFVNGQKAYNGVATLVKKDHNAALVTDKLYPEDEEEQARFIDLKVNGINMINIYLPNGNPAPKVVASCAEQTETSPKYDYKLEWMNRLYNYLKHYSDRQIPFLIGGDFNIIPEDIDCHAPELWRGDALIRPESRSAYRKLLHLGLTEAYRALHPDTQDFTFWDYQAGAWPQNHGIRIDHFLLSPALTEVLDRCEIDKAPRDKDKASDHTPIWIELDLDRMNKLWEAA